MRIREWFIALASLLVLGMAYSDAQISDEEHRCEIAQIVEQHHPGHAGAAEPITGRAKWTR